MQRDTFSCNAAIQLEQLFEALRDSAALPEAAPEPPIGFVYPQKTRVKLASCE